MANSISIPSLDDISETSFDKYAWLRTFVEKNEPASEQIFAALEEFLRTEISRRVEQFEDSLFKTTIQLPALHRQATRIESNLTNLGADTQKLYDQLATVVNAPVVGLEEHAANGNLQPANSGTIGELVSLAKCADAAQAALRQLQTASDWSLLVQSAQVAYETRQLDRMPQLLIDLLTATTTGTPHENVTKRRQVDEFGRKFVSSTSADIEQLVKTMHVLVEPRDASLPQNAIARQHSLPHGSTVSTNPLLSRSKLRTTAETLCRLENICKDAGIQLSTEENDSSMQFDSILKRIVAQHRQDILLDCWSSIASTQDSDTLVRLSKFFNADAHKEAEVVTAWNYELQIARDIVASNYVTERIDDAELNNEALKFSLTIFRNFITSLEPTLEGLLENRQLLAEQQLVSPLLPQQIIEFFSSTLQGIDRLYRIMLTSVDAEHATAATARAHVDEMRRVLLAVLGGSACVSYINAEGELLAQQFAAAVKNAVAVADEIRSAVHDSTSARHSIHSTLLQALSQPSLLENSTIPFVRRWIPIAAALSPVRKQPTQDSATTEEYDLTLLACNMLSHVFKLAFYVPLHDYFRSDIAYGDKFLTENRNSRVRQQPDFASWRQHAERLLVAANWTGNILNVFLMTINQVIRRETTGHDSLELLLHDALTADDSSTVAAAVSNFSELSQTILAAAHAAMSIPIVAELMQDAENWSCWYDDRSLLPTYALAPQEYMTRIGQHLMMVLPGVLEPFDYVDADNISREYCAGLRTSVALTKNNRQTAGVVAYCLEAATHRVVEAVLDRMDNVMNSERVTRAGRGQCRADLEYLQNVVDEFGFITSERLLRMLDESKQASSAR